MLETIQGPQDIKGLTTQELNSLADEIREALFNKLTKHGGHFGPNFGFVEGTLALHSVFNSPRDKFIFDVSHLVYPHKMLTGRAFGYLDDARFDEISGYSNPEESAHDHFKVGHTSTSVALATGMAYARNLAHEDYKVVAVIGDGSLSGGEALEALDYAGQMSGQLLIIVNDNEWSIAENHGGLYANLRLLRETQGQAEKNLFKAFGLDYRYLEEGNDVEKFISALNEVKDLDHPVVLHIHTEKSHAYEPALKNPEFWHYTAPFDRATGDELHPDTKPTYGSITRDYFLQLFKEDPKAILATAGVPAAIGFNKAARDEAGEHFVDVGIAEEHGVAMMSAAAKAGAHTVFATASTFMQRAFDQIEHDLCINQNPATLLITGASVRGMRDVTHLGLYATPMASNIPDLLVLAPQNKDEYLQLLDWSIKQDKRPCFVIQPVGAPQAPSFDVDPAFDPEHPFVTLKQGSKVALIAVGSAINTALATSNELAKHGIEATLVNPRVINRLDTKTLDELAQTHDLIVTIEETSVNGGFGQKVAAYLGAKTTQVLVYGVITKLYDRFDLDEVLTESRLKPELICEDVLGHLA